MFGRFCPNAIALIKEHAMRYVFHNILFCIIKF